MAIDPRLELLKTLRATPIVAEALIGSFPNTESLRRRPAAGAWAAVEVVGHLADTEEHALARVRRMVDEDEPTLDPFDPEALAIERRYLDQDVHHQLGRLAALRSEHVTLLEGLDDAGWNRVGIHGEHGRMTVERYETHVAAEEVDHLAQLARLLT
ncbi:MAG TPA: DinB family protein [Candidatus Angelobacter sp.]|nr:DinB family protein [Candidatus Angelobacter sp.]